MILVIVPAVLGSPTWALLFVAIFVLCLRFQEPLADRPNPLLSSDSGDAGSPCTASPGPDQGNKDRQTVIISAEGGGIRAAYWTAVALQEISNRQDDTFVARLRRLSGVSGGSLGLATWIAAQELPKEKRLESIKKFLSQDFLTPLVAGLLFVDAARLVLPTWIIGTHRGDYFEQVLAERWQRLTGSRFFAERACDMKLKGADADIFFNATDALSGAFVAFGNRIAPNVPGAIDGSNKLNLELQFYFRDIRIAQAVHTSARFFYLSPHPDVVLPAAAVATVIGAQPPANILSTTPVRLASLVDGGYFDNSAVGPILEYLQRRAPQPTAERGGSASTERPTSPRHASVKVLHISNEQVRVCAQNPTLPACVAWSSERLVNAAKSDPLAWVTRPLEAIFSVRSEHSHQRSRELAVLTGRDVSVEHVQLEPPKTVKDGKVVGAVPLGWALVPRDCEYMDGRAIEAAEKLIKKL